MTCRPSAIIAALVAAAIAIPLSAEEQPDLLAQAHAAIGRGDGIAAEEAARAALEAGLPKNQVAPYMGRAELLQGDIGQARYWLEPQAFAESEWGRGYHALALLRKAQGDLPGAAKAFDRALERGPGSASMWVDFGRVRYLGGEQHLALEAAIRALELGPDDPQALRFRAQLARDADGLVAATEWFERALEQSPDDTGLLGEYAATLGDSGRYADMLVVLRKLAEIDPGFDQTYFLQAVLAARAGEDNLARRLIYQAGEPFAGSAIGLLLSGVVELRGGNATLAVEHFDAMLDLQPENRLARILYGRALMASGEANEAIVQLLPMAERDDAGTYLLTLTGRAYEQVGDREAAALFLDRAAAADGRLAISAIALDERGELLLFRFGNSTNRGDVAVAMLRSLQAQGLGSQSASLVRRLSDRFPQSSDVDLVAGDVMLLSGNDGAALAKYGRSSTIRRPLPVLRRMVAARRMRGDTNGALDLLGDYLQQNPKSSEAALAMGDLLFARGDMAGAVQMYQYAIAIGSLVRHPRILRQLGTARLATGDVEGAWRSASLAYALQRSSGPVSQTLSRIAARNGASDVAQAFSTKADRAGRPGR